MKKRRSRKRILIVIIACVFVLLIGGGWAISVTIYQENFNRRFETFGALMLQVEDFAGLQRTRYEFPSDRGQILTGYMYHSGSDPRGIIVIAHGFGGGGHNSYMDCANYFAQHGYYVFAYDATGNDESEGAGVGGTPQGVIDLDHAISFIEESGNFPDLPIGLFGHSWGGYSVCNVLKYHPEVNAVIECAGFNRSSDLFEAGGNAEIGSVAYAMLPFIRLHERIKYGKYASNTAVDGFEASKAAVMAVHSSADTVIPGRYGYDLFYDRYRNDPRFTFILLPHKKHDEIYNDSSNTYKDEVNVEFAKWLETLDYDYKAAENRERFAKDKAEYLHAHLDRAKWCDRLDEDLFRRFLSFYDRHLQN